MATATGPVESILAAAVDIGSDTERQAYIEQACAGDAGLKRRVEQLIDNHFRAGSFLEDPASEMAPTIDQAIAEGPGTVVGPYRLMEQVGEGGMGIVFVAEQQYPVRRKVALKLIKPGMDSKEVIARFDAERQALALMDHPNIAKVLEAGVTDQGRPYFVMELVRGIPVTDYCDRARLGVLDRLGLFVQVCQAVQHAHQKGVIHRDLKPSNVLVTEHDGTPVAKVIDFGVAKAVGQQLTDKTVYTRFLQLVGSPLYMSPEQAGLSGLDVDTRADIYALGVLLYELLTGTTPFDKERFRTAGYDEVRQIIREEEPPKPSTRLSTLGLAATTVSANRGSDPRKLCALFRGELDWVVMKALEKDRNRRYETAAALIADVRRYLADEPVLACPPSAAYRCRKFIRRNSRAVATAAAVGLAVVMAVAVLAASTILIARALRSETELKGQLADTLDRERHEGYYHRIILANRELSAGNMGRALQYLSECPDDLRGWDWYYLKRLCRVEPLVLRDKAGFNGVAFSPDGTRLASAGGDGVVKIWNSRTGRVLREFAADNSSVCSVTFHPDGRYLATVGADRQVKVWDLDQPTGHPVFAEMCDAVHAYGTAYGAVFRPGDGRQLAVGNDGAVQVWDWTNHQALHTFAGHERRAISVAFSADGRRLASGDWRGGVRLWDPEAGPGPVRTFTESRDSPHPACAVAFSSDGRRVAAASYDRHVGVWDTQTGELVHKLLHSGLVLCVAFNPTGNRLASGGEDKTVHIWDATTGRELLDLAGHTDNCGCIAFSQDGRRLASASTDGTIRVWDATPLEGHEQQEADTFTHHNNEVWALEVSPDGRAVVSAGLGTYPTVWDPRTGKVTAGFRGHNDVVFCVTWQPDGKRIASAGGDRGLFTVKVWDSQTGKECFELPGTRPGTPEFMAVAFSTDGRYLVTGRTNGSVDVWDARTGDPVGAPLGTHKRAVRGVLFSPDGRHLASESADGEVKLWDATRLDKKQNPRATLWARVHGPTLNMAFSPDGRRLATGGDENTVMVWDVETARELRAPLRGHTGDIYSVAFSPGDGRWIVSAGEDSTVKVWDSHDGYRLVRNLRGHTGLVSRVAFSLPDGRRLYSGSRDRSVKVWDTTRWADDSDP